jgi:hypothetical protein
VLPAGLSLNASTGQISGTPTAAAAQTTYTVSASNIGGSTTFALSLTVNPPAPSALSYPGPQTYIVGAAITPLNSSVVGIIGGYSVSPALPVGLLLNSSSGQVTGTPTSATVTNTYVITASNVSGSATFGVTLTVNPLPPAAPVVTVGYGVKQVVLNWTGASGATHYQVFKNPGSAGYTQLGSDLTTTTYPDVIAVHLTDWINASYIVAACNSGGCTNSTVTSALDATKATGYFKASNTSPNSEMFGRQLALSADGMTLAVGASSETSGASGVNGNQADKSKPNSGAVYVFVRNGNAWTQQAYIKASNSHSNDLFGSAVALSADGNTLAVGAVLESSNAIGVNGVQTDNSMLQSGAAYVLVRTGTSWSQQAYVKASNPDMHDRFGSAVAISGDGNTLAVGAIDESSGATGVGGNQADNASFHAGAVYVFKRNAALWLQQTYVKASNPDINDEFGNAISLSADGLTMAVGALAESGGAAGVNGLQTDNSQYAAGAVYVFTQNANVWSQQAYLKASNPDTNDAFGISLALSADGSTLAVGASGESSNAMGIGGTQSDNSLAGAGAVYLFARSVNVWVQQYYIKASNPDARDAFGTSVSLSADGTMLGVGAVNEASNATGIGGRQTDNTIAHAGAAYMFLRSGATWVQRNYVKASNTDASDYFGASVAMSADGSTLAVGAYGEASRATGIGGDQTDNIDNAAGAVYVY